MPKKIWLGSPPTHKSFRPYTIAIGEAALGWNGLHQALANIFWTLTGNPRLAGTAIWNAIRSDRTQRQILKAVVGTSQRYARITKSQFDDLEELLGCCETLASVRDAVIHSPLISHAQGVSPDAGSGHLQAKKLINKNLLTEFRWCRDSSVVLTDVALRMHICLVMGDDADFPWPNKFSLPNRGQKKARPNPPPQSLAKQRSRQRKA